MSDVFGDFMINQHVNAQLELQKIIAELDQLRTDRARLVDALKEALCHCEDAFRSNNDPQAINYSEALCRCIATLNKVLGEK